MNPVTPLARVCVVSAAALALTDGLCSEPLTIVPHRARSEVEPGEPLFTALDSKETGVRFVNSLRKGHPLEHLYASGSAVGGVAVGDIDGDDSPDLFFTNGPSANRLFRQVAPFKFEDITEKAGVHGAEAWGTGAAMADLDNDGDLDIYVANYDSPNHLYLNRGDGTFEERARDFGLDASSASQMPTFCDYDRDGDLDVFLLTNRYHSQAGQPEFNSVVEFKPIGNKMAVYFRQAKWYRYFEIKQIDVTPDGRPQFSLLQVGQPDLLYRNDGPSGENGQWRFTDVSKKSGITEAGFGLSATWFDYNRDGWPDLWVGNDLKSVDRVYRNNKDGTFTDVVKEIGPHITWFSMGADFADLNGDALPDFLIADMSGTTHYKRKTSMGAMDANSEFLRTANPQQYMRNALFLNSGTERFLEAAYLSGLANSDWTWSVKLSDFDNDGRPDAYFTNGMTRDFNVSDGDFAPRLNENEWERHNRLNTPELRERNLAFRNRGDLQFEDVSKHWGLDHVGMSFAAAHADFDGDGDLDLVVVNCKEPAIIYRNNEQTHNRLTIRLVGTKGNSHGIGAQLTLETASGTQIRELTPVRGYLASNQPLVHFGLGAESTAKRLTIDWPSGQRQEIREVAANQHLTITEPAGPAPATRPPSTTAAPYFAESQHLARAYHAENDYDDYARQPLLPHKLSRLGPGQAWGDIDSDGDDDFWIGSGFGLPGQIWRNDGEGRFAKMESAALAQDANREDMGGLWFDADGDRDLDLYVCSGGYEFPVGNSALDDRLYLNDGTGQLRKAPEEALPSTRFAGSVVTAADFDQDGDLDLFVGGRLIPGDYPATPRNLLLLNEGGRFTDQIGALAPELDGSGLVTSALWSDADGDGWPDLLVTHEWGPVKFFRNSKGKLRDETSAVGLADLTGWWNGIAGRDLDGDGDLDYLATNFGLNTKYHANPAKPALLYYGDFEGNGRKHLVEAEFENDVLYPVRGRSCSSSAMPHLKRKYGTFQKFALDSLATIYSPECLQEALKLSATTLESGVFLNESAKGKVKFRFLPLPRLAQISPSFGVAFTEVNGDGIPDALLAQNYFSPQPETGRMAGGLGLLLIGKGDGRFDPVSPHQSGVVVPGDARSLTTCDLDGDDRLDFTVGLNHDLVQSFTHQHGEDGTAFLVRLAVPMPGTRIACQLDDGSIQLAEWQTGGGYLSQRAPIEAFGVPSGKRVNSVQVRWPDGKSTRHSVAIGQRTLTVQPE